MANKSLKIFFFIIFTFFFFFKLNYFATEYSVNFAVAFGLHWQWGCTDRQRGKLRSLMVSGIVLEVQKY